ncbi:MAG: RIP metalloprotease RseP [Ruminobacter sp.]|uniref:RIP metalloprotease RseP n=1 Tax=Ruminobacter sp. TaxID=2774296 RepID=UPI001B6B6F2E|nr:RIP metalloprotease RseP [Ruminobacter sp.]MBP3749380.1 RIP metalloprotease RseP [Ruminobacter sp.]
MTVITSIFYFVIAIGILIAIHEAGHFVMARLCGVYVERFALGFGPRLCSFRDRVGTEYALCAIPLGGYVKMYGEDSSDSKNEKMEILPQYKNRAFCDKKVWQKFLIVFAGPFCNIVLAWFLYTFNFMYGVPDFKPAVEVTDDAGVAAQAGFRSEDLIVSVGGVEVADWEETLYELISHVKEDVVVGVRDNLGKGELRNITVNLSSWNIDPRSTDLLNQIGLDSLKYRTSGSVAMVVEGGAAEKAGLKADDRILSYNGQSYTSWRKFAEVIRKSAGKDIVLNVERDGHQLELNLIPDVKSAGDESIGFAGISPKTENVDEVFFERSYPFGEAVVRGGEKTYRMGVVTLQIIKKFITGDISVKNVSGPIGIAKGVGLTASLGLVYYLSFLALVSVNLGVLNLMPIPVLDGGHLFFYIIEFVRGKPMSQAVMGKLLFIGMLLLLSLMLLAVFNDIYYGL